MNVWQALFTGHVIPERPSMPPIGEALPRSYGLKELFPGDDAVVDLVFIHGLYGDRELSWTADNGALWIRDLLPAKIPQARILTYGYNAHMDADMQLTTLFHDRAETFIAKLVLFRQDTSTEKRPIIFIAHSLGGILLKFALLHANMSHSGHLPENLDIIESTYGIFFMGTPHQGSPGAELGQLVLNVKTIYVKTSSSLLQHLRADSEALQRQLSEYKSINRKIKTKFFYEMYKTQIFGSTAKQMIVPRFSAVVPGDIDVEAIALTKDHVDLVKYMSAEDDDYQTVSSHLKLMVKEIPQKEAEAPPQHQMVVTDTTNRDITLQNPNDPVQIIPRDTGVPDPIATGRYLIRNVFSGNLAALVNDDDRTEVVAITPGLERGNIGDQWDITLLDTGILPPKYTMQNHRYALYGSCDGQAENGGNVCGKDFPRAWIIKETNTQGRYIISPTTNTNLFWGLTDGEHRTPLTLKEWAVNTRNQWFFHPVGGISTGDDHTTVSSRLNRMASPSDAMVTDQDSPSLITPDSPPPIFDVLSNQGSAPHADTDMDMDILDTTEVLDLVEGIEGESACYRN